MSADGSGAESEGGAESQKPRTGWVSRRPEPGAKTIGMTPEQGCLTCSVAVGVLLVTVLVWVYIYWRFEPAFHEPGTTPPIPFVGGKPAPRKPFDAPKPSPAPPAKPAPKKP